MGTFLMWFPGDFFIVVQQSSYRKHSLSGSWETAYVLPDGRAAFSVIGLPANPFSCTKLQFDRRI
jgi:hypothetical protein